MNTTKRYSPEVRERAVRLVFDHERERNRQFGLWPHLNLVSVSMPLILSEYLYTSVMRIMVRS